MSKKTILFTVLLSVLFITPFATHAANLPLLNPDFHIVPDPHAMDPDNCPEGAALSSGALLQFIQNIMNVMISVALIAFTLIMVWAGFLFIGSAGNPEQRSRGKTILINAVIGLVIVLAGWLIVDFVMKKVYGGNTFFGPWNQILKFQDGDSCIIAKSVTGIPGLPAVGDAIVNSVGLGGSASGGAGVSGGAGAGPAPRGTGKNCVTTESQVVKFPSYATDGNPTRRDLPDTVNRFLAMRAAAAKDGIKFQAGSSFRSDEEQLSIWNSRNCDAGGCVGNNAVAKPCAKGGNGSNHTRGTAIDIQILSPGGFAWLMEHGKEYGFYHKLAQEKWHFSDTGY